MIRSNKTRIAKNFITAAHHNLILQTTLPSYSASLSITTRAPRASTRSTCQAECLTEANHLTQNLDNISWFFNELRKIIWVYCLKKVNIVRDVLQKFLKMQYWVMDAKQLFAQNETQNEFYWPLKKVMFM